jgi:type II secretory pathway component PulC
MTRLKRFESIVERSRFVLAERIRLGSLRSVVQFALSVALAAEAARTSIRLWTVTRPEPELTRSLRAAATPSEQLSVQALVAAHLFGQANRQDELPASAAAPWMLSGTLQGSIPGSGAAILGHTATTTRFCKVGQEVSDGFTLAEVFLDHVTIARAGERLTLKLPRMLRAEYPYLRTQVASAEVPRPVGGRSVPQLTERPANRPPAYDELRPQLHRGDGRVDGMRVLGTGDGRNLDSYGLQRNDVIRQVDGQAITNIEAQRRALDTLSQGRPVAITVERNGSVFALQLGFGEGGG